MIVLRTNPQRGLKIQGALERLERQIDGAQTCTRCCQSIVNMCGFGLALQCALKHLLRSYVFTAIKLDYATIVK